MDVLYNDCNAERAPELIASVKPHAYKAFMTKATAPGWADAAYDGKRVYVHTLDDHCNPSWLQDLWLEKSKVKWDVVDFQTGHMPFVSQPEKLAEQIIKAVKSFSTK